MCCGLSEDPDRTLLRSVRALKEKIEAVGFFPETYCWCFDGRPDKPFDQHTGECRELKLALRKVEDLL